MWYTYNALHKSAQIQNEKISKTGVWHWIVTSFTNSMRNTCVYIYARKISVRVQITNRLKSNTLNKIEQSTKSLNTIKKVTKRAHSGRLRWNSIFSIFFVNFFFAFFCTMTNYRFGVRPTEHNIWLSFIWKWMVYFFSHRLASIFYSNPSNSFFTFFSKFFFPPENNSKFQYLHNTTG